MNQYNYHRRETDKLSTSDKLALLGVLVGTLFCFALTYWALLEGIL